MLGADAAAAFNYVYDVSESGNFEAANILNRPKTIQQCAALHGPEPAKLEADLAEWCKKLLAVRNGRIRPGRDDKVLVAWNGLTIDAFAERPAQSDSPRWLAAATKAADFILTQLRTRRWAIAAYLASRTSEGSRVSGRLCGDGQFAGHAV